MTLARGFIIIAIIAGALGAPALWYEIDRSPPLEYLDAYFDVPRAAPGQRVKLTLKIKWPRQNCSTELERTFIGSDGHIYKIVTPDGYSTVRLGPPPAKILDEDSVAISTRDVVIPEGMPEGIAIHSPNAWERCTSPALKWGDYISEIWPIFIGPRGAEAKIMIVKP